MDPERLSSCALFEGLTEDQIVVCTARFQEVEVLSDHNIAVKAMMRTRSSSCSPGRSTFITSSAVSPP